MGKAFIAGVHAGGKVIRKKLPGKKYINLVRVGHKWVAGEVKKRKKDSE